MRAKFQRRMGFAVLCTVVCGGLAGPGVADVMTKEELFLAVSDVRETLNSGFHVEFTTALTAGPAEAVEGSQRAVSIQGEKIRIDRTYLPNGRFYGASFDGQDSWSYLRATSFARVESGVSFQSRAEMHGSGFFDMMRWYPCREILGDPRDVDLLEILASPNAVVRPETEVIDGHETHVVDVYKGLFASELGRTLWIDAERGYLPILQKRYRLNGGEGDPQVSQVIEITEAHEIGDGVWVPVSGTYSIAADYDVEVDFEDDNGWNVSLVSEFDPGHFDYSNHIPPGVYVRDMDSGEIWIAKGDNLRATGEAAFASLPKEIRDKFADRSVQAQRAWWIPPYDEPAWLAVTAGLSIVTVIVARKLSA